MQKWNLEFKDLSDYSEYVTEDTEKKVSELETYFVIVVVSHSLQESILCLGIYEKPSTAEMVFNAVSCLNVTYVSNEDIDVAIEKRDKNGEYSFWY